MRGIVGHCRGGVRGFHGFAQGFEAAAQGLAGYVPYWCGDMLVLRDFSAGPGRDGAL